MELNLLGVYLSIANGLIMFINFALASNKFYGKVPTIFLVTKPLIVQFIFFHLYLNMEKVPLKIIGWCVFCFIGDIILLFRSVIANKLGCISFLVSQIIISLYYEVSYSIESMKSPLFLCIVLPPLFLFMFVLYPKAIKYKPIYADGIVYLASLILALASSVLRADKYNPQSLEFLSSCIGHFFFIISDYFLINATIMDQTDKFNIIVLPTYIIALIGISTGVILSQNKLEDY